MRSRWLESWLLKKPPTITYSGYNCGCCGKWIEEEFEVLLRKSNGRWMDTWGLCEECGEEGGNK